MRVPDWLCRFGAWISQATSVRKLERGHSWHFWDPQEVETQTFFLNKINLDCYSIYFAGWTSDKTHLLAESQKKQWWVEASLRTKYEKGLQETSIQLCPWIKQKSSKVFLLKKSDSFSFVLILPSIFECCFSKKFIFSNLSSSGQMQISQMLHCQPLHRLLQSWGTFIPLTYSQKSLSA